MKSQMRSSSKNHQKLLASRAGGSKQTIARTAFQKKKKIMFNSPTDRKLRKNSHFSSIH